MGDTELKLPPDDTRSRGDTPGSLCGFIACGLTLLALVAALWVVSAKNLPGTVNPQEIGRYQFAISAALTRSRFGIGGFVFSVGIYEALKTAGLSSQPADLRGLGVEYPDNLADTALLQRALEQVQNADIPRPLNVLQDGHYRDLRGFFYEDLGLATLIRLSFAIFGQNLSGITYTYFLILGVSALFYAAAFHRRAAPMTALPLLVIALYLICTNALISFQLLDLKDPRFLGTIAAIPILHLLVILASPRRRLKRTDYLLLIAQSGIFAFAIHVRSPTVWAVLGLGFFLTCIVARTLWTKPRDWLVLLGWRRPRSIPVFAAVFVTLGLAQVLVNLATHPLYKVEGDLPRHQLWAGIYSSLEINPEWGTKYLTSVNGAHGDDMPEEALRQAIAKLPPEEQRKYVNNYYGVPTRVGGEQVLRHLFFDFIRKDPGFVLTTFFVIKPVRILQTALNFHQATFAMAPAWRVFILLGLLLAISWIAAKDEEALGVLAALSGMALFFAVLAWLPNWLVVMNPLVMIDNFLWTLLATGLLITLGCVAAIRAFRHA